jgi:hypothetical protein
VDDNHQARLRTEFIASFGNQTVPDSVNFAGPTEDWLKFYGTGYDVVATQTRTPVTFQARINAPGQSIGLDDAQVYAPPH